MWFILSVKKRRYLRLHLPYKCLSCIKKLVGIDIFVCMNAYILEIIRGKVKKFCENACLCYKFVLVLSYAL